MTLPASRKVRDLAKRGVLFPHPSSVEIAPSVNLDRIAPGVTIHAGCRIDGRHTSIGPSCVIGEEAPVTLNNCQLSDGVALRGGFFSGSVFLSGVSLGSCAHVRPGTLLEEQAGGGHSVGLKQTVLMPFVTLGSLINFCDCLMAGGTSRHNHSEVGSSYVHFNFTPHQDKATPSLLGDVPRGVMLDQPPVFLGGQGGLVGPARIEYGTILAAGTISRRDILQSGRLVFGETGRAHREHPYEPGTYGDITRIIANNLGYIGNLHALLMWYTHVRTLFMHSNPFDAACHKGAMACIRLILAERIGRMTEFAAKLPRSLALARRPSGKSLLRHPYATQTRLIQEWPALSEMLEREIVGEVPIRVRDKFLAGLERRKKGVGYIEAIQALDTSSRRVGTGWLQSVVDSVTRLW